jgi:quinol monooxygenase YgiN
VSHALDPGAVTVFALFVRFDLRPGAADGFDALVNEMLPLVRSHEPGTLVYVCTKDLAAPESARLFFELYRDRAAFDDHERQEHVARFLTARGEFVAYVRVEFVDPYDGKCLAVRFS